MTSIDAVRAVASGLPRSYEALARLAAVDDDEVRELVLDAWRMCAPTSVAAAHLCE